MSKGTSRTSLNISSTKPSKSFRGRFQTSAQVMGLSEKYLQDGESFPGIQSDEGLEFADTSPCGDSDSELVDLLRDDPNAED